MTEYRAREIEVGNSEYISICGLSAVGKKTLILKLLDGELQERFALQGSVEAYGSSFRPLAEIFDADDDHVLHQWQMATHHVIEELRDAFPSNRHRVIVIWRPWAQHLNDKKMYRRYEMTDAPTQSEITDAWHHEIVPRFQVQLPALGFDVELVNGSAPDYDRLEWQDVEKLLPPT